MSKTKDIVIPIGWSIEKIDNICDILDSLRVPVNSEEREKLKGNIPYYGANGLQGYINDFIFNEDLVLVAEDGGNFEDYQIRPIAYKISGKSWVNNHAHILKTKNGNNLNFFFYSIVHKNILTFIAGGTRSKLNQSELKNIKIQIPQSLKEQEKIAEILSTVDEAIEKTDKLIEKYKKIKVGLMKHFFTKGIDINTGKPHTKYKESELGRIPESWSVEYLKDIATLINGRAYKQEELLGQGTPILRVGNLFTSDNWYYSNLKLEKNKYIENGDLIYAWSASFGPFIWNGGMVIYHYHIWKILLSDFVDKKYLYYSLLMDVESIKKESQGGTMMHITKQNIENRLFLLPKKNEQEKIARILTEADDKIEREEVYKEKLEKIKKGLMNDLLTGKVRVKF